jgi:hypothetical protein
VSSRITKSEFFKGLFGVKFNDSLTYRYCNVGDILGATTILEHMKERDMTVNEHVFHSLIIGHCR